MRFKLDENFGTRTQQLFYQAGHDVSTVREELLLGASDQRIIEKSQVTYAQRLAARALPVAIADPKVGPHSSPSPVAWWPRHSTLLGFHRFGPACCTANHLTVVDT